MATQAVKVKNGEGNAITGAAAGLGEKISRTLAETKDYLHDKIGRVMIPMEEFVEVRGGKKVVSPRMSYPGYVLVEMDLDDNTWHIVRSTPRVTGFVGSAISPSPLSDAEVDAIINRVHVPTDRPKPKVVFERNEQVRIVDGPFANFNGSVEEIDNDHSRLKVSVTIFGRSTPVELDFASVEKLG